MSTELVRIETITAVELFKPGTIDPLLKAIKDQVRAEASKLDIATEENRKAIASLAFKVAKSKTFIDGQRRALVAEEKARLKAIDQEGARIWDELEELQREIRKPLTDWENAEKARVARHEANLNELIEAGTYTSQNWQNLPLETMRERLKEITSAEIDWQEFHSRAVVAVVATVAQIKEAITKREKFEADQAELARLRAEAILREQREREERIAAEAKAQAEAEAKRRQEAAALAAQKELERIENERYEAEARAKEAETRRLESEAKAKQEAKEAAERAEAAKAEAERAAKAREAQLLAQAEASKQAAIEAERKRAQAEEETAKKLAEERERNKAHVAKINREIRDALVETGMEQYQAEAVIKAIVSGRVPHTKITY